MVLEVLECGSHRGDYSPVFMVVGEALRYVALGQPLEVVAMGCTRTSLGLAQVAQLADYLS